MESSAVSRRVSSETAAHRNEPLPRSAGRAQAVRQICINGRFLTQASSGVQRFARELLAALDAELDTPEAGAAGLRWRLLVPAGEVVFPEGLPTYRHIEIARVGKQKGHLWDQLLPLHCGADDLMINLANGGPIWRGRSLAVLHDAAVYRTPHNFTRSYAIFHRVLGRLLARRSSLCTVSEFSRTELADVLGVPAARIAVVPNGCDHMKRVTPDLGAAAALGLEPGRYFLSIGSPVPNKNLRTAIEGFSRMRREGERFVVVGSVNASVFGQGVTQAPPGVVMAGRLPDAQIAGLLRQARALVFPSLYEGFGIPPLEAMLAGCPVLASDIPVVREVCGDAAWYFDPHDADSLASTLQRSIEQPGALAALTEAGLQRTAHFTWQRSARCLLQAVQANPRLHP